MVGRQTKRNVHLRLMLAVVAAALPAALASPGAAHAQAAPTTEELRLLEQSLGADRAQAAPLPATATPAAGAVLGGLLDSVQPDLSLVLNAAAAAFSEPEPLQSGAHDPHRTGFTLQQLELVAAANVDPYLHFEAAVVFSEFGVETEEAFATTLALPWNLQAKAGQFLQPFGRLNPTHPHGWQFVDQPFVLGKFFGGEASRGAGAQLGWLTPLPWFAEAKLAVANATGACCARSFFGGDELPVRGPQDLLYTMALQQFFPFSDSWSLLWGLSAQLGPNASGNANRTGVYGTDLYLRFRPVASAARTAVSLQVEWLFRSRQVPGDALQDHGGYAQLVWDVDPRWSLGARGEYGSGLEGDPLDPEWTEGRQRHSVQVTWRPSHFSRLRLQGGYDRPQWRDEAIWSAMLQLETVVGAHGAHVY